MKKLSKTVFRSTAVLVVFFVLCGQVTSVGAQVELVDDGASKEEINLPTPKQSAAELPPLEKIVDFVEYDRTIPSPLEGEKPIYVDTVVRYTYIDEPTTKTIINESTEQIDTNTYRTYSSQTFIQNIDEQWYELKSDVMKPELYDSVLTEVLTTESYLRTAYAYAQTTTYSGSGDGACYYGNSNIITARTASSGSSPFNSDGYVGSQEHPSNTEWIFYRAFFPFNTSYLTEDDTIESAVVSFVGKEKSNGDNDGDDYLALIGTTTQASETALVNGDYDTCGNLDAPTIIAPTLDISDITNDVRFEFELSNLTTIKRDGDTSSCGSTAGFTCLGLREGHDIENVAIQANVFNGFNIYTSEYTGTDKDPYIEITLAESEPEPEPEATTTMNSLIVDMPYTQELTMITAMSVVYGTTTGTATPLSIEYTYYHIPLVAWLIIAYLLMNSLWFIYAQVKNYDRRR